MQGQEPDRQPLDRQTDPSPVFVLGCTPRSGSTLLQRYLNSTGEVFVWGEHAGLLGSVQSGLAELWRVRDGLRHQTEELRRFGGAAWIANISPDPQAVLLPAARSFITAMYGPATAERGIRRWGFKEVRYDGAMARFLLALFPAGRVIFLVRHPHDALASAATVEWNAGTDVAPGLARQWKRTCASFLKLRDERVLHLRYEDLVGTPEEATGRLARHVGIAADRFAADVLAQRVRGSHAAPRLDDGLRAEIAAAELADVARAFDYRVGS